MALHHRFLLDKNSSTPAPSNVNRTREAFTGDANFDTNMVIILAALLCALICALGLNSIVRCALRCSRRFAFETPEETAARLVAKGLKKSALHQIPIVVYGSGSVGIAATDCPICLGEFLDGEKVRVLPKCNHGFHVRQSLLEQPTISGAVAAGNSNYAGNASAGQEHVSLAVAVEEVG
ncbi:hypothetical protein V8G54_007216 [Vigna mungo]|uniref:RING-type E3 ubiquitin transferase n=1 Tax=Vigna mungo TaxID=3915 RepID=A0AAQ3S8V6_VIGMU